MAAADIDEDVPYLFAGHLFSRINGADHGMLGVIHVDDRARLDALAGVMADPGHADAIVLVNLRNEAADFAGTDVQRCNQFLTGQDLFSFPLVRLREVSVVMCYLRGFAVER